MAWACSANQIEWRKEGFEGSRLAYLLAKTGYFHEAHRAMDDCRALLEILAAPLPKSQKPALSALLHQARRRTVRIWAEYAPYELKDELKKRRYRWSDGNDGRPKAWYIDVDEADEGNEIAYLCKEIYCRDVELRTQSVTALTRILKSELRAYIFISLVGNPSLLACAQFLAGSLLTATQHTAHRQQLVP